MPVAEEARSETNKWALKKLKTYTEKEKFKHVKRNPKEWEESLHKVYIWQKIYVWYGQRGWGNKSQENKLSTERIATSLVLPISCPFLSFCIIFPAIYWNIPPMSHPAPL